MPSEEISEYNAKQKEEHAQICSILCSEIEAKLSKAVSKIWHGSPVWFIGENPVVGYCIKVKGVQLLFWSGQLFEEAALKPMGKDKASEIIYTNESEINLKDLKRWLKKASSQIWDYQAVYQAKRKASKQAGK